MRGGWVLVALALLFAGCGKPAPQPPPPLAEPFAWAIVANQPPPHGVYLSNGYLGMKAGPAGDAWTTADRRGPLFRADEYRDRDIEPQPNPFAFELFSGRTRLFPDPPQDYRQQLDMRTGLLRTKWSRRVRGAQVDVTVELTLDRSDPSRGAIRYTLKTDRDVAVELRTGSEVYTASAVTTRFTGDLGQDKTNPDLGYVWKGRLHPGTATTVEMTLVFSNAETPPTEAGFDDVARASAAAWKELWKGDIEIAGSIEDQQLVRSWLFNLYQSIGSGFLPPMGFSSDTYHGRIFWDQDIWMLPALLPFQPQAVRRMLQRRVDHLPQARTRAERSGYQGARFPWEATPWGDEGAPPEFRNEIHINGDVLLAAHRARTWGVELPDYPELAIEAARFWASRIEDGHIRHVISPDESAGFVDDDLYTNALAAWCLREGAEYSRKDTVRWRGLARSLALPRDEELGIYLTYAGDKGEDYKQAAALLALYPLGLAMPPDEAERMFDHYKDKVVDHGPAMADAIHSIIAARLGWRDEATGYFRKSYEGFVSWPGLQFSERRKGTPRTYFLTGAGGALQAVLYGIAGLDVEPPGTASSKAGDAGTFAKPISDGYTLRVRPSLPAGWRELVLKGVHLRGEVYEIRITADNAVVTQEGG